MALKIMHSVLRGLSPDWTEHRGEIVVIGLGRFGSALAHTLVEMGYEVLGVDMNDEIVQRHSGSLTHVVRADTTDERALRQIGAADAITAAVCIGNDIESSVLTAGVLVDLGVKNIWAKAITEAHGRILQRVGAHHVVFPEAEMGNRVAHLLTGQMMEYIVLDDDFVIVETTVPAEYVGKTLGTSNIRAQHRVTVVCVKPNDGQFTYASPDSALGLHDLIVIAGHRNDVERFAMRP